ncbi:hypothetical protein PG996_012975 [Apiospora saccharicola]|uniref:C3H1-type domain-containing protein n=1 Tax=Apiospora saccharicola TaxID=335842 RepID=A0ABR1U6Z8_9PEZI
MATSLLPTTGPTIHSPSEASYSSGPSHTSTRSTSPDDTSSHRSSPLLDLRRLITTSSIVPETIHALIDQHPPPKMDKTTSVLPADVLNNVRRSSSKFNMERVVGPANYQQPPGVRPGAPMGPGNLACRSLTSNNWRTQAMADSMYNNNNNFDTANPQNQQQQHFGRLNMAHPHHQLPPVAAFMYSSNDSMMAFPDALLDSCYAYCYDRGNGQYTRLIPADMIPNLRDVPALQQDCLGMIVLPAPRALPANGRSSNVEPVMLKTPPATPTSPTDNIQAHIDTIVGVGPRTPTHSHGGNNSTSITSSTSTGLTTMTPASNSDQQQALPLRPLANNQGPRMPLGSGGGDLSSSMHAPSTQHHGGHGHSQGHGQGQGHGHGHQAGGGIGHGHHQPQQQFPQRRPKIYCDKWVHEGVCAFTQQGCKYKHEMPFDKMTQHQLGLFHGLPQWWKKHQAELARQRDPSDGEQDGSGSGTVTGSTGERLAGGGGSAAEHPRSSSGGFLGRSACGSGGDGGGAAVGGNLAWRRSNFASIEDTAHGFGDHSIGSPSARGGVGSNPGGHGPNAARQHQRGNPMAPQSPLAYGKSPFGPIAPPAPIPTGHALHQPGRRVISTPNPYASLSNVDEGIPEENKTD